MLFFNFVCLFYLMVLINNYCVSKSIGNIRTDGSYDKLNVDFTKDFSLRRGKKEDDAGKDKPLEASSIATSPWIAEKTMEQPKGGQSQKDALGFWQRITRKLTKGNKKKNKKKSNRFATKSSGVKTDENDTGLDISDKAKKSTPEAGKSKREVILMTTCPTSTEDKYSVITTMYIFPNSGKLTNNNAKLTKNHEKSKLTDRGEKLPDHGEELVDHGVKLSDRDAKLAELEAKLKDRELKLTGRGAKLTDREAKMTDSEEKTIDRSTKLAENDAKSTDNKASPTPESIANTDLQDMDVGKVFESLDNLTPAQPKQTKEALKRNGQGTYKKISGGGDAEEDYPATAQIELVLNNIKTRAFAIAAEITNAPPNPMFKSDLEDDIGLPIMITPSTFTPLTITAPDHRLVNRAVKEKEANAAKNGKVTHKEQQEKVRSLFDIIKSKFMSATKGGKTTKCVKCSRTKASQTTKSAHTAAAPAATEEKETHAQAAVAEEKEAHAQPAVAEEKEGHAAAPAPKVKDLKSALEKEMRESLPPLPEQKETHATLPAIAEDAEAHATLFAIPKEKDVSHPDEFTTGKLKRDVDIDGLFEESYNLTTQRTSQYVLPVISDESMLWVEEELKNIEATKSSDSPSERTTDVLFEAPDRIKRQFMSDRIKDYNDGFSEDENNADASPQAAPEYSMSTEAMNRLKTQLGLNPTSFEGLSRELCYSEYVNGYRHYLDFAKQFHENDRNFSAMVKYQAHKHHKVDDIGKYILNKLPDIPPLRNVYARTRRYILDDVDSEEQDVSTKSDESWFKKHFYMFLENGQSKKFHTSQAVSLKTPSANADSQKTEDTKSGKKKKSKKKKKKNAKMKMQRELKPIKEESEQDSELKYDLDEMHKALQNKPLVPVAKPEGVKGKKGEESSTPQGDEAEKPEARFARQKDQNAAAGKAKRRFQSRRSKYQRKRVEESLQDFEEPDIDESERRKRSYKSEYLAARAAKASPTRNDNGVVDITLTKLTSMKPREGEKETGLRSFFKKFRMSGQKKKKVEKIKQKREIDRSPRFNNPLRKLWRIIKGEEEGIPGQPGFNPELNEATPRPKILKPGLKNVTEESMPLGDDLLGSFKQTATTVVSQEIQSTPDYILIKEMVNPERPRDKDAKATTKKTETDIQNAITEATFNFANVSDMDAHLQFTLKEIAEDYPQSLTESTTKQTAEQNFDETVKKIISDVTKTVTGDFSKGFSKGSIFEENIKDYQQQQAQSYIKSFTIQAPRFDLKTETAEEAVPLDFETTMIESAELPSNKFNPTEVAFENTDQVSDFLSLYSMSTPNLREEVKSVEQKINPTPVKDYYDVLFDLEHLSSTPLTMHPDKYLYVPNLKHMSNELSIIKNFLEGVGESPKLLTKDADFNLFDTRFDSKFDKEFFGQKTSLTTAEPGNNEDAHRNLIFKYWDDDTRETSKGSPATPFLNLKAEELKNAEHSDSKFNKLYLETIGNEVSSDNKAEDQPPRVMVDTTLFAYDDGVSYVTEDLDSTTAALDANSIKPKKNPSKKAKLRNQLTHPSINAKATFSPSPRQYYSTPVPMATTEFEKFLKENRIDVKTVTAPTSDMWKFESQLRSKMAKMKASETEENLSFPVENVSPSLVTIGRSRIASVAAMFKGKKKVGINSDMDNPETLDSNLVDDYEFSDTDGADRPKRQLSLADIDAELAELDPITQDSVSENFGVTMLDFTETETPGNVETTLESAAKHAGDAPDIQTPQMTFLNEENRNDLYSSNRHNSMLYHSVDLPQERPYQKDAFRFSQIFNYSQPATNIAQTPTAPKEGSKSNANNNNNAKDANDDILSPIRLTGVYKMRPPNAVGRKGDAKKIHIVSHTVDYDVVFSKANSTWPETALGDFTSSFAADEATEEQLNTKDYEVDDKELDSAISEILDVINAAKAVRAVEEFTKLDSLQQLGDSRLRYSRITSPATDFLPESYSTLPEACKSSKSQSKTGASLKQRSEIDFLDLAHRPALNRHGNDGTVALMDGVVTIFNASEVFRDHVPAGGWAGLGSGFSATTAGFARIAAEIDSEPTYTQSPVETYRKFNPMSSEKATTTTVKKRRFNFFPWLRRREMMKRTSKSPPKKKKNHQHLTDTENNKVVKRELGGGDTFTAKNVAALEVVVDLVKTASDLQEIVNSSAQGQKDTYADAKSVQVHIAIPSYTDNKRRGIEPDKIRRVFSAKMVTPVDLEYQVRSFEVGAETTLSPGANMSSGSDGAEMYWLVETTYPLKGNLGLKSVKGKVYLREATTPMAAIASKSDATPVKNKLTRITLSKDFIAAINKEIAALYTANSSTHDANNNLKRKARSLDEHDRKLRFIDWEAIKRYFGHDRVCSCNLRENHTMCKACAASDAVMRELSFEFNNIARYMTDHCTEIQTYFWMNPSGGRKLRDTVHRVDTALNDYYKRVKGKCQGRTCEKFSTYMDKREPKDVETRNRRAPRRSRDVIEHLISDMNTLIVDLDNAANLNILHDDRLKRKSVTFANALRKCIASKSFVKRSGDGSRYSLDNVNVNIICKPATPPNQIDGNVQEATASSIASSNAPLMDYDADETKYKKKLKILKALLHMLKKNEKEKRGDESKKGRKRDTNTQVEAPLIADPGGSFWHDYLYKRTTRLDYIEPKHTVKSNAGKPLFIRAFDENATKEDEMLTSTVKTQKKISNAISRGLGRLAKIFHAPAMNMCDSANPKLKNIEQVPTNTLIKSMNISTPQGMQAGHHRLHSDVKMKPGKKVKTTEEGAASASSTATEMPMEEEPIADAPPVLNSPSKAVESIKAKASAKKTKSKTRPIAEGDTAPDIAVPASDSSVPASVPTSMPASEPVSVPASEPASMPASDSSMSAPDSSAKPAKNSLTKANAKSHLVKPTKISVPATDSSMPEPDSLEIPVEDSSLPATNSEAKPAKSSLKKPDQNSLVKPAKESSMPADSLEIPAEESSLPAPESVAKSDKNSLAKQAKGNSSPAKENQMHDEENSTPADDSLMPGKESQMPAKENQIPAKENQMHAKDSEMPAQESQLPAQESQLPAKENQMTAKESQMPTKENEMPAKESQMHTKENQMTAKESQIPAQESQIPAQESQMPAQKSEMPVQESQMPVQESDIPTKDSLSPTKDSSVPTKDSSVPAKDNSIPEKDSSMPAADSSMPAADSLMLPADSSVLAKDSSVPAKDNSIPEKDNSMLAADSLMPPADSSIPAADSFLPSKEIVLPEIETSAEDRSMSSVDDTQHVKDTISAEDDSVSVADSPTPEQSTEQSRGLDLPLYMNEAFTDIVFKVVTKSYFDELDNSPPQKLGTTDEPATNFRESTVADGVDTYGSYTAFPVLSVGVDEIKLPATLATSRSPTIVIINDYDARTDGVLDMPVGINRLLLSILKYEDGKLRNEMTKYTRDAYAGRGGPAERNILTPDAAGRASTAIAEVQVEKVKDRNAAKKPQSSRLGRLLQKLQIAVNSNAKADTDWTTKLKRKSKKYEKSLSNKPASEEASNLKNTKDQGPSYDFDGLSSLAKPDMASAEIQTMSSATNSSQMMSLKPRNKIRKIKNIQKDLSIEAYDSEPPNYICDIDATIDHIHAQHAAMKPEAFEEYVKNITCTKYTKLPKYFLVQPKRKKRRRDFKPSSDYFDRKVYKWDWIRAKRYTDATYDDNNDVSFDEEYNDYAKVDLDDVKEVVYDPIDSADDYFDKIDAVDRFDEGAEPEYFEKFFKGDDDVYRARQKTRRKRTAVDMRQLAMGLRNMPKLTPALNQVNVMRGDDVTLQCTGPGPDRMELHSEDLAWFAERRDMLRHENVVVNGPFVVIKKADERNVGNYSCVLDGLTLQTMTLNVLTLPEYSVLFIPMYCSDHGCTYDDLKSMQQLGSEMAEGMPGGGRRARAVRIDEPICMQDKSTGASHIRSVALLPCPAPAAACSAQCRRDLRAALALLCAKDAPKLAAVPVILTKRDGRNNTLTPHVDNHRDLIVTHTLRHKESSQRPDFRALASRMRPGDVDVAAACGAGYRLVPRLQICCACPADTMAAAGANACVACPAGAAAAPGAARCRAAANRYDVWQHARLWALGALCVGVVCVAGVAARARLTAPPPPAALAEARLYHRIACVKTSGPAGAEECAARRLTPSRVILARLFRSSRSSNMENTDSQVDKFEKWKERNIPPPLPPIDFDMF